MAEPLRAALAPLVERISAAFVCGSTAKRQDAASSDVDLMIVSDGVTYPDGPTQDSKTVFWIGNRNMQVFSIP